MAHWDGGSGTSDGRNSPGSDSGYDQPESQEMITDAEMNVNEQTNDVVYGILKERIPNAQSILDLPAGNPTQKIVIQRLIEMGDEVQRNHKNEFRDMFHQLGLHTKRFISYNDFFAFAIDMFPNGINMGRIIVLLAFVCYAIKLKQGYENDEQIVKNIVFNVLRFLKEEISVWIASQGGWKAALDKAVQKAQVSPRKLKCIGACAVILPAMLLVYYWRRK